MKTTVRRTAAAAVFLIFTLLMLSGCSETDAGKAGLQAPSLPLKEYTVSAFQGGVPVPDGAEIYELTQGSTKEYEHYAYTFENFTLEEAKEYIALLEETVVTERVMYEIDSSNDYPVLSYFSHFDGGSVSLSQSGDSGGITVNIKISQTEIYSGI